MRRRRVLVSGQVQGVGFRPFVFRLAARYRLTGRVGNTDAGVCIDVQGASADLDAFTRALRAELPPLARLDRFDTQEITPLPHEDAFQIVESQASASAGGVLISPDVATCPACLAEFFDPADRRALYPFINCTDCGPRYTLTRSVPYDRAVTSMACFPLCPDCAAEYQDPTQRRFHAQPNACPVCGPRLWFCRRGEDSAPPPRGPFPSPHPALLDLAKALRQGEIAAIKGLGGFHLACDAFNEKALARLRTAKRRPHQSLAVMVPDVDSARCLAHLRPQTEALLQSRQRPIVIVPRRAQAEGGLPPLIAPDLDSVGLMLPYTPLHHALLHLFRLAGAPLAALVMTSGNASAEPICLGNREAVTRLSHIADCFLFHDRDILVRADDSVLALPEPLPLPCPAPSCPDSCDANPALPGALPPGPDSDAMPTPLFYRRARGFVPEPLSLVVPSGCPASLLAVGGELKGTLCLTRGEQAFVSQHLGEVSRLDTLAFFEEVAAHLRRLLGVAPQCLVRDLHPDFLTSRWAEDYGAAHGLPVVAVQHHLAHIAAVLAENGHTGPALGLALDGSGFGPDGTVWGGELLWLHPAASGGPRWERLGRLSPFALPGGDAAVRQPWRIFTGLRATNPCLAALPDPLATRIPQTLRDAVAQVAPRSPQTSSCGRLFDAVAAALGLGDEISYEGQAAIRLEQAQHAPDGARMPDEACVLPLVNRVNGLLELDPVPLVQHLLLAQARGVPQDILARSFHHAVLNGFATLAAETASRCGCRYVALSGGVMQNRTLWTELPQALRAHGLIPLMHRSLPPNDACLSLGQAFWAAWQ